MFTLVWVGIHLRFKVFHVPWWCNKTLASWIAHRGGRVEFCRWLHGLATSWFGSDWLDMPVQDAWERLLEAGDTAFVDQVEQALYEGADKIELLGSARDCPPIPALRRNRKRACPQSGEAVHSLSRCQRRNLDKRFHRVCLRRCKRRNKKCLACARAFPTVHASSKRTLVIGTWSSRGLEAKLGKDPDGKLRAICRVVAERKWSAALLTDLKFEEDGCCNISVEGAEWLLVHECRVGVALNPFLARRWREGGSVVVRASGWSDRPRAFGLDWPFRLRVGGQDFFLCRSMRRWSPALSLKNANTLGNFLVEFVTTLLQDAV